MRVVHEHPPIFDAIKAVMPITHDTIYAYGEALYVPSGKEVPQDILLHEEVHARQQTGILTSPDLWWQRYLIDPAFRLEQELEAYAVQFFHVKRAYSNSAAKECLFELASNLSTMYNLNISVSEAESLIRKRARQLSN